MIPTLDQQRTAAYLRRLGVPRERVTTDLAGLTLLHERHLRTFPFENLDIALRSTPNGPGTHSMSDDPGSGEPIVLDVDALVDKLTVRGRGGFCYELNGAFASLLTTLGFAVTLCEARVGPDGGGMPFDHLCLRVRLPSGDRLADVGFGASFLHPLDLEATGPQADPAGTYQIVAVGDDAWDMVENGEVQYRFFPRPRELADFAAACRFHQTSPDSHFTQGTVCSLATADGRVTISGRMLITTVDGRRTEQVIASDDELLDRYRRHFGIMLDRVPLPPSDVDGRTTG